jgi:integrase
MRKQTGCIREERGRWTLRWRETIKGEDGEPVRVMKFKVLDLVTAEDRRNRDRKTGRLRVPPAIAKRAEDLLEAINLSDSPTATATMTISTLVDDYFKKIVVPYRKPSTAKAYKDIWRCHLKHRIGQICVCDLDRASASRLWGAIVRDNPTLSRRTLSHIRFFVSGIYENAKDRGLFKGENPAAAALPEGLRAGKPGKVYTLEELNTMLTVLQESRVNKSAVVDQTQKEYEKSRRAVPRDNEQIEALEAKLERAKGALVDAFKAEAVLAMAFGSGLRKGELQGLMWEHFKVQKDGSAKITVAQSVWHGQVITPKTEASSDVIDLGEDFVAYIEEYRKAIGGVDSGFLFGYSASRPIDLDSFRKWVMLPMLNRCAICKRPETVHGEESVFHPSRETKHGFKRDETMPIWKGWHAFRRGAASYLAKNFGSSKGVEAASRVLRHSDEGVTQNHYVSESKLVTRARAAAKQMEGEQQKQQAADVLAQGLRTARKQARIH